MIRTFLKMKCWITKDGIGANPYGIWLDSKPYYLSKEEYVILKEWYTNGHMSIHLNDEDFTELALEDINPTWNDIEPIEANFIIEEKQGNMLLHKIDNGDYPYVISYIGNNEYNGTNFSQVIHSCWNHKILNRMELQLLVPNCTIIKCDNGERVNLNLKITKL